jgi:transposase
VSTISGTHRPEPQPLANPGRFTLRSLLGCLDSTLRALDGAPTYVVTDNEKTVTVEHTARVPVRPPDLVAAGRHYGMTIRSCVPANPQTKGGSEATVRVAKADLVPTEANLRAEYVSFAEAQEDPIICATTPSRRARPPVRAFRWEMRQ